ncbi:MAG: hypothetical protein AAFQ68_21095 [Bacteroidota bacterium]
MPFWESHQLIKHLQQKGSLADFLAWLRYRSSRPDTISERLTNVLASTGAEALDESICWQMMGMQKAFVAATFRKYRHDLAKKLHHYLSIQQLEKHPQLQATLLADYLLQEEEYRISQKHYRKHQKQLKSASILKSEEHLFLAWREDREQKHSLNHTPNAPDKIPSVWRAYDRAWIIQSLRLACMWHSRKTVTDEGHAYSPPFLPAIQTYLEEQPPLEKDGLLFAYHLLFRILTFGEAAKLSQLIQWLSQQKAELLKDDLQTLYDLSQNALIRLINTGEPGEWENQLLTLLHWGIKTALLNKGDYLHPKAFKNFIFVAIKCQEYSLASEYLELGKARLSPFDKAEFYPYLEGYFFYSRKDYRKMKKAWKGFVPKDKYLYLTIQLIRLQARYESYRIWNDPEELKVFKEDVTILKRSFSGKERLSESQKATFQKRLQFFQALLKLPVDDEVALSRFAGRVALEPGLANRQWFVEQINHWQTKLGEPS